MSENATDAMEYHKRAMYLCQQADDIRNEADRQARELMRQAYEMEKMAAEMCPHGVSKEILRQSATNILEASAFAGRRCVENWDLKDELDRERKRLLGNNNNGV